MQRQLFSQQFISVLVTVSVGLALIGSLPAQAEKRPSQQRTRTSVAFQPPAGQGMPQRTAGGASRTGFNCPVLSEDQTELTALVPAFSQPNNISSDFTGLTTEASPKFYFFVPAMAAQEAVFSLKDQKGQDVYQTSIPLSGKTGILSVKLPSDAPSLKIGQSYRWSFGIICQTQSPQNQPEVVFVTGEIRRVKADSALARQLQQLTPLEKAALYAQNGIWFESIEILANLRQTQPENSMLTSKWQELLQSVGLEEIANQPFID
ncbi:DUF928 domain-containing protein [Limnoraphis robusta]|uniref:DUF928 domain-containing protein n=1 Tax=Limnoraphis robusta CCNP1315 TaxID=3110306 RepID=A0ABU5U5V6_9CYAN|nr:DUF928 domain-containing protein [Limnoraphis robusta]MEA5522575.1 DUF928 domain-containing protein [Limnoraphis robusta CCNP1315]MEA5545083.1 DUF928 domain-containing protein [Limnoraphis robusta CCNP1324]